MARRVVGGATGDALRRMQESFAALNSEQHTDTAARDVAEDVGRARAAPEDPLAGLAPGQEAEAEGDADDAVYDELAEKVKAAAAMQGYHLDGTPLPAGATGAAAPAGADMRFARRAGRKKSDDGKMFRIDENTLELHSVVPKLAEHSAVAIDNERGVLVFGGFADGQNDEENGDLKYSNRLYYCRVRAPRAPALRPSSFARALFALAQ